MIDLVRLALAFEFKKKPLKRSDFNDYGTAWASILFQRLVLKGKMNFRSFDRILTIANDRLRDTFGMELVMLPYVSRQAHTGSRTVQGRQAAIRDQAKEKEGARTDQFILVSCLPEPMRRLVSLHRDEPVLGLTAITLTIIHLAGGEIGQPDLMDHLRALEIDLEGDAVLGRLEDQLDRMRRERYLFTYKAADDDGTPMWGIDSRGRQEFPPEALKAFALELVRGTEKETSDLTERIAKSFAPELEASMAIEED